MKHSQQLAIGIVCMIDLSVKIAILYGAFKLVGLFVDMIFGA